MSEAEGASLADVTKTVEEAEAQGFVGEADPRDRDEYALTSGPESPTALEASIEAKKAELEAQTETLTANTQDRAASAKAKASNAKSSRSTTRQAEGA